ncbi:MAG: 4-hydroxy-tetrahydrodipicolinate reductase [Gammaproteobacteria bacterium]|nr:4-hydroxy-tetrahydrodipicolinate reductase [Gammaproteobacteria bacterium]
MSIRVFVNGAYGRMGEKTVKAILDDPELEIVGEGKRGDDLKALIIEKRPAVVVDFTSAEVVYQNALTIIEAGIHPVIGTSGLSESERAHLQAKSAQKKLGGVIAPNFSLGALWMMQCAEQIVAFFPHVEIIEKHHPGKKDSPSATALQTAERIVKSRKEKVSLSIQKETVKGARGALYQNIPIHSVRLPGIYAEQEVIFGGSGETLTLSHVTFDRSAFMPGVLLACKKVIDLDHLVYGLENL